LKPGAKASAAVEAIDVRTRLDNAGDSIHAASRELANILFQASDATSENGGAFSTESIVESLFSSGASALMALNHIEEALWDVELALRKGGRS
jgi:hypothetical protein